MIMSGDCTVFRIVVQIYPQDSKEAALILAKEKPRNMAGRADSQCRETAAAVEE